MIASAATGTELGSAPGVELVLEVVRMAVNVLYSRLMPTLNSRVLATEPRSFGTVDAIWFAFQNLTN